MSDKNDTKQRVIIGVRFFKVGKIYHFDASNMEEILPGDNVVVETSRGWQLGEVTGIVKDTSSMPEGGWKHIDRKATPKDLLQRQNWQQKEADVVSAAQKRSKELGLRGVKFVNAEYSFDGSRLSIQFCTESEEKADLKSMRSDMQRTFQPSTVDLRQVGPRDVAKCMGGMGACGLETRCCTRFLTEFSSISIRMAKEQSVSLTPSEITGMCGRLRCCLIYEYQNYVDARQQLPKRNKMVKTPKGVGKVVDVIPLQAKVVVEIPEIGYLQFSKDEIEDAEEPGKDHDEREKGKANG
jgi:cell fate regulator YaaT (PSP1 superfamily)